MIPGTRQYQITKRNLCFNTEVAKIPPFIKRKMVESLLKIRFYDIRHFRRLLSEVEWASSLYSLRPVTEVNLGPVRSNFGWVTSQA